MASNLCNHVVASLHFASKFSHTFASNVSKFNGLPSLPLNVFCSLFVVLSSLDMLFCCVLDLVCQVNSCVGWYVFIKCRTDLSPPNIIGFFCVCVCVFFFFFCFFLFVFFFFL